MNPCLQREISNSEPVRWSKSMSTSQKCEEGKSPKVTTGTPWRKPPCIPEWQFHAPTSAGQESPRHQMLSRSHCPAVETTQNTKGFFKVSVRPLLPLKKKGSKTKQLLDLLYHRVQYQVPFHPYFPLWHRTEQTRSFCNAQLAVTTLPNGIFTSTEEEKHFNCALSHS